MSYRVASVCINLFCLMLFGSGVLNGALVTQPYTMSLLLFRNGTDAHSCQVHILDSGSYLWPVYSLNFCYQELVRVEAGG